MRPLHLEVEGLTSFRDRVALDFAGLDLFAITGPTGAGKSSLIDAMVLALFGQVPRVSDRYKQLISHGAERLSVRLDFEVGGEKYRVARTIRASGNSQLRLERLNGSGPEPLADRDRDIREHVERILGLDYDAFVRSVVLPQGQFDAFLKGKPEERRKILVSLLNLKVYEDMHGVVNRRATEARREADFIARQLATDFAGATTERLEALRKEQAASEKTARALEKSLAAVADALECARRLREARRDQQSLEREVDAETARAARARDDLEAASAQKGQIERQAAELERALAATGFDEARLLLLSTLHPRVEQLAAREREVQKLEKDAAAAGKELEATRRRLGEAEAALPGLEKAGESARQAQETARAHRDELQRRHAAHALRQHLRAGQPCPVCEQRVRALPEDAVPAALEVAEEALRSAEATARGAEAQAQQGRVARERLQAEMGAAERHVSQAQARRDEARREVHALRASIGEAGLDAGAGAAPLLARVTGELSAIRGARATRDRLATQQRALGTDRAAVEARLASARAQAEAALERLGTFRERQAEAAASVEGVRKGLLARGRREGWKELDHPLLGQDEVDVLEARQGSLQKEREAMAATAARLCGEAERMERDMARAGELGERKRDLEQQAALAATLAQHLQANQFIAYVQEEALRVLADDASRHLKELSKGRYSLGCDDQDFHVVDHWNADRERSVKTLSGGETFLASLALALALAERLADLAAEGRGGDRLESLFLDEGFGSLDPDTLELVLQALETLHGGERMVGVVTHIAELAERLPARVTVSGGQGVPAAVAVQ